MLDINIKNEKQQGIKQFILELYKIKQIENYKFNFVINSTLLELCDKQFISESELNRVIKDLDISTVEILSGPVKFRISPFNTEKITIENNIVTVQLKEDRKFRIDLNTHSPEKNRFKRKENNV